MPKLLDDLMQLKSQGEGASPRSILEEEAARRDRLGEQGRASLDKLLKAYEYIDTVGGLVTPEMQQADAGLGIAGDVAMPAAKAATILAKIRRAQGIAPEVATSLDRAAKAAVVSKEASEPISMLERIKATRDKLKNIRSPEVTNIPIGSGKDMTVYEAMTPKGQGLAIKIPKGEANQDIGKRLIAESIAAEKGLAPELGAMQTSKGKTYIAQDLAEELAKDLPLAERVVREQEALELASKLSKEKAFIPQDIPGMRGVTNLREGSLKNVGIGKDGKLQVLDLGEATLNDPEAVLSAREQLAKRFRSLGNLTPEGITSSEARKLYTESAQDAEKLRDITTKQLDMAKENLKDKKDFLKRISEPAPDLETTIPNADKLSDYITYDGPIDYDSPLYMSKTKKILGK